MSGVFVDALMDCRLSELLGDQSLSISNQQVSIAIDEDRQGRFCARRLERTRVPARPRLVEAVQVFIGPVCFVEVFQVIWRPTLTSSRRLRGHLARRRRLNNVSKECSRERLPRTHRLHVELELLSRLQASGGLNEKLKPTLVWPSEEHRRFHGR